MKMASKSSSGYKGVKMDDWIIVQTTVALGFKVAQPLFEHGKFSTEKEAKAELAKNKTTITKSAGIYDSFRVEVMQFKQFTVLQREIYRENFGSSMGSVNPPEEIVDKPRPRLSFTEGEKIKKFIATNPLFKRNDDPVSMIDDFTHTHKKINGEDVWVLWVRFTKPEYKDAKKIIEKEFPHVVFERAGDEFDLSYVMYLRATKKANVGKKGNFTNAIKKNAFIVNLGQDSRPAVVKVVDLWVIKDIAKATLNNKDFQNMIYTGEMQISLMQIPVHEDTGFESHKADQFFRVEKGRGFLVGGDMSYVWLNAGDAIVVPSGVRHNLVNASHDETLSVYTIYSKPTHAAGYISKGKPLADAHDLVGVPIGTQIQELLFKYEQVMNVGKYDYKTPERVVFKDSEARKKELQINAREMKGLIEVEVSMRKQGLETHLAGLIDRMRGICKADASGIRLEESMEGKNKIYKWVGLGEELFSMAVKHDDIIKEPSVRLILSMNIREGSKWIKERPELLMAISLIMDFYVHE